MVRALLEKSLKRKFNPPITLIHLDQLKIIWTVDEAERALDVARQQAIVQAIYARPVRAYSYELPGRQGMRRFEAQGLLTADEMADCLAEVIGFADLDLSLPYSRHSS